MASVPREAYAGGNHFVDLRNLTTDTPSMTHSALGKRHLEADASLALVGNLLQKQSEMQQRLLKDQQGDRVRSAAPCHHGLGGGGGPMGIAFAFLATP